MSDIGNPRFQSVLSTQTINVRIGTEYPGENNITCNILKTKSSLCSTLYIYT